MRFTIGIKSKHKGIRKLSNLQELEGYSLAKITSCISCFDNKSLKLIMKGGGKETIYLPTSMKNVDFHNLRKDLEYILNMLIEKKYNQLMKFLEKHKYFLLIKE